MPHERLINKLRGYGIDEKLLQWSRAFLTGRKQRVVVNGEFSSWSEVLSGVPQGSVLGPLYFVLFINDMPDVVHNFIALFADDAKVFSAIANETDHSHLQQDIHNLHKWSQKWQLTFNAKKCKTMYLGKDNKKFNYTINNTTLDEITQEKDLGVMIDNELKFDIHVERQVNKANAQLGLIRRSFDHLDKETFLHLYKSLVRTHIEYCNVVASPIYERQMKLLEGVQRRATKLVPGLQNLDYIDRLKALRLPSLYYRRLRGDIIETYKYLHNIYKVENCPLILDDGNVGTRGHSLKLKKIRCHRSQRQKFFSQRVVEVWNKLPEAIVSAPTLNTLKNRLDAHWAKYQYNLDKF